MEAPGIARARGERAHPRSMGFVGFARAIVAASTTAIPPAAPTPAAPAFALPGTLAMILAGASVLAYMDGSRAPLVSRAIYEGALEAIAEDVRTADLGGHAGTTEFTDEVIKRVRTKLDVWSALGETTLRY